MRNRFEFEDLDRFKTNIENILKGANQEPRFDWSIYRNHFRTKNLIHMYL